MGRWYSTNSDVSLHFDSVCYSNYISKSNLLNPQMHFNCSCYVRSQSSGSWDAARKDCRDRGADLVVIGSPEEQTFLSTISTRRVWLGLTDEKQEGTWKWVDGTPLTLSYWGSTQPDNGGEEDCAHVYSGEDMSMNDLSCSTSLKWICEKKSVNPTKQKSKFQT
uniref:C-type lectin domain-containing protein n=2 Tax=Oreochromis TaxID=8139 RepID=A0A669CZG8_ORENI